MGLISASWRIWLTFVPEASAGGQQQNLVQEKTPEILPIEPQTEYDVGFRNVTWQPSNLILIMPRRIFPLTHDLQNGMLIISQIQESAPFQADGNPQIELEIAPLRIYNPLYPEIEINRI